MSSLRFDNVRCWTGVRLPDGSYDATSSVLVRDGRVVALGASAQSMPADEILDCRGGFLCPAFGDGHVHPAFGGLERQYALVRDLSSPEEIARSVGDWARRNPDAEWIRGEGFDHTLAPEGVFLASWLDAEVPDRPVVLRATDYHTVWVNSEALRRAGYGSGVAQPHDGEIVLDESGAPVGTLREWGAWRPVYDLLPRPREEVVINALRFASESFSSAGLTWVQDAWVEPADVDAWLMAEREGALTVAADLALWADPNSWREQVGGFVSSRDRVASGSLGLITASTVKFFADGVVESGTSAMLEPFCDCPHSKGLPNWAPDELASAVASIDSLGFTAHIHAIGDYGVRMALDAIAHAARVNEPRDRRWVIVHNQLIDPSDLPRFAELGVIANFEPYWSKFDAWQSELSEPRLGPERTSRQFQTATVAGKGARVSFGSDWPVTTYAPLAGIQVAVTRQVSADQPPWMPEERISVEEALAAYTSGVAFQAGRDDAGVIRPGAVADLVLLESDPRAVDAMDIGGIEVVGTWRAGTRTYER
ncbi:MAG: amidohydrolase [Candidatus Nanopelagicales bacterium]|nr:amidohydrolase [Candidatus Nanopelagicales bacterium]MCF8536874.1 amidohydrolase [Candidatus Nanopelagicales bacterium]MCF8542352.1 amidohydrolase [Candidatus Nanopelagicales bacterium]